MSGPARQGPSRRTLPAGPVIDALNGLAARRGTSLTGLFDEDAALQRVVFTAREDGRISPQTVDRLWKADLLVDHPEGLFGPGVWDQALRSETLGQAAPRGPQRRVRLADCQAVYDAMAATAVNGMWTGTLASLVASLAADGAVQVGYQRIVKVLPRYGWVVCRRHASPAGTPSLYELVQRPEPERWPCAGCPETICSITADGVLRHGRTNYHSPSCRLAAARRGYAARLDRVRVAYGLAATGHETLTADEIQTLLQAARLAPARPVPGGRRHPPVALHPTAAAR